jgi:hypothetical protein
VRLTSRKGLPGTNTSLLRAFANCGHKKFYIIGPRAFLGGGIMGPMKIRKCQRPAVWFAKCKSYNNVVRNLFGLSIFYFQLLECIFKPYRQVLTPVDNLLHLLRQPIFNKFRLVLFHLQYNNKGNCDNCFSPEREKRECG